MSLATLRDSLAWLRNPYQLLDERLARSERCFRMRLAGMGPVLVTGEPEDIEDAVRNDALIGGRGTRALRPVVGDGALIVREGAAHRAHRALLAPFFSAVASASHDELVIGETDRGLARIGRGERFRAVEVFDEINLAIIVRVVFGAPGNGGETAALEAVRRYVASIQSPALLFVRALHLPFGRFSAWGRHLQARSAVRAAIAEAMRQAQAGTLAAAVHERVEAGEHSEAAGVDALLEILLFGHDTASATLAWWAAHLHADLGALRRARDEARIRGPYLAATIKESMRLCPVVPHLTRFATRATSVGRHAVGQGEHVFLCSYLAHRDPRRFEAPAEFRPQRFLEADVSSFCYFPFGLGGRLCAGFWFAMRQMELVASRFLLAGEFLPVVAGAPAAERRLVLMAPANGMKMERA